MITIPGHTYTINVLTAPVSIIAVSEDGTQQTIATAEETGQYGFRAQTIQTIFSPDANVGYRTRNVEDFNGASSAGAGGGGGSGKVDQTFDPTSKHAQSGIAIAAACIEVESLTSEASVASLDVAVPDIDPDFAYAVMDVTGAVTASNDKWYRFTGAADLSKLTIPTGVKTMIIIKNPSSISGSSGYTWSGSQPTTSLTTTYIISVINVGDGPVAKVSYTV